MKNKYKILSLIISCLLAYLSYENPINDRSEIVPQIIIHAWIASMYMSAIIFSINAQDLLTSEEKEVEKNFKDSASNLQYLILFMFSSFVTLSAGNIVILVNYNSLETALVYALLFFVPFAFVSVKCLNLFDKRNLQIQWVVSFTLIPILSVSAISILGTDLLAKIKMNQLWLMIFVFVLFFISFLSFYITKTEEDKIKKPAT